MTAISQRLWQGVQSYLDHYVTVSAQDSVVILYTSDSAQPAAWVAAALEIRGIVARRVWMAPIYDPEFHDRALPAFPDPAEMAGRLVVLSFEKDTLSHMLALAELLGRYNPDRCFVCRAISAGTALFETALHAHPDDLTTKNAAILNRCMDAERLRVTTDGGTDLQITIDSDRYRWISNRGRVAPGSVMIVPAGEVATFPASISGVHVADFAFNMNAVTSRDARLDRHPVTVRIEDGRAIAYKCADAQTTAFLDECFETHCAYRVGELGFGTNACVGEPIAMNSHINERRPGVHIGFGQHNQDFALMGYQCPIHLDLIARGGRIWVDDDLAPIDLDAILPSDRAHPEAPSDQDVFSPGRVDLDVDDCCGILTAEGLELRCQ